MGSLTLNVHNCIAPCLFSFDIDDLGHWEPFKVGIRTCTHERLFACMSLLTTQSDTVRDRHINHAASHNYGWLVGAIVSDDCW